MTDAALYLWNLAIAVGIFGFGFTGLRALGIRRAPLAVAGIFGVSLWIALGAYLNLLHLLRPAIFFALASIGILLAFFELLLARRMRPETQPNSWAHFSLTTKLLTGLAVAVVGILIVGSARPLLWCVDDIQGYAAMAVKAAQNHSIQPDPFSERRVQAGVGGGNFLDTMMFATGDLRAMTFIDSSFGMFLYALGLWAIGRRWKIKPAGIAFALLCLPFASLMKVNLTIVYLSVAAFFATLLLLSDASPDDQLSPRGLSWGRILAVGIIVGASCTTKSPNIVFLVPFLLVTAAIHRLLEQRAKTFIPTVFMLLVAASVFLPWSIANKATTGTYLYPLLGPGIHASAYHFIPQPSQLGTWPLAAALTAPDIIFLAVGALVAWKLTREWPSSVRSAAIAYLLVTLLAIPVIVHGLGGQSADRYTAPLLIPALLISLLIVLGASDSTPRFWHRIGMATQVLAALYIFGFIEFGDHEYMNLKTVAYQAVGIQTEQSKYMRSLNPVELKAAFDYGTRIQSSIPAGATVLSVMYPEFPFDFRRNTVDIADWPGMASPPPGLPLEADATTQRQFFRNAGVRYIIDDAQLYCPDTHWDTFFELPRMHYPWSYFFLHESSAHSYIAWQFLEIQVSCHEREVIGQIVAKSPQVFNDGHIIVARID